MEQESIYGKYQESLEKVMEYMAGELYRFRDSGDGARLFEHLNFRIKSDESMREKCDRQGIPQNAHSALRLIHDAIGFRIVCLFVDDVYKNAEKIKNLPGCRIVKEKDYIKNAKPNGYRSYHLIVEITQPYEDADGNCPGKFFVEIQIRTIAMDSWAALEHELKYKRNIKNERLIVAELKRCADELAACDVSMQTIRQLIRQEE